jgi:anti-sigma regulatory factor (Ser/Thr protein kinase)
MNTLQAEHGETPPADTFRHEALLYAGADEFVAGTASFIRSSLAADEPIMVAVIAPRTAMLRDELGADARRVRFIDMEAVGRNPARIIPAWQDWVEQHVAAGRSFRGIGEPIWAGRSAAEIVECQQHEALLNTAFDPGPGWWLLCPYDTAGLDDAIIDRAHHTHPAMLDGDRRLRSASYPHPELSHAAMFRDPLPAPAAGFYETEFAVEDLTRLRQTVAEHAAAGGLSVARVKELVLAVNELTSNSIEHGGGAGTLRLWRDAGVLLMEVHDQGVIDDPLIGRRRPRPSARGGAGLWMANQLCDLVQIRSSPATGSTVRVHMALPVT